MTYDPREKVACFAKEYGEVGLAVLFVWNTANPLRCYYGDDCNPDEYLGYVERFIKGLDRDLIALNRPVKEGVVERLVRECVRRSFYPSQFAEGWVTNDNIEEIMAMILSIPTFSTLSPETLLANPESTPTS